MKIRKLHYLLTLSALCCITACSEDSTYNMPKSTTCSSDDDCSGSKICKNGKCAQPSTQKDKCTEDTDCNEHQTCKSGKCVDKPDSQKCKKSSDCDDEDKVCREGYCSDKAGATKPPADSPKSNVKDTDGDTIADIYDTCDDDTDDDGIVNCKDEDSDGDTIPDSVEANHDGDPSNTPNDADNDGIYDFMDLDSDDNGIPDATEAGKNPNKPVDTDGDTVPDYITFDNDGDMVDDVDEIVGLTPPGDIHPGRKCGNDWCTPGTPKKPWDSDGDTIPDYLDTDSDGDTIPDSIEMRDDTDNDGILDRYDPDSDNDGIPDSKEVDANGKPLSYEKDGNIIYCFRTDDCDNDALPDSKEVDCGNGDPKFNDDSDGDGYPDGAEYMAAEYALKHGLLNGGKISSAKELVCNKKLGVKDVFEFYFALPYGGIPQDDDLLFEPSVKKLDLVFNVDTTESMTDAINNVKTNINGVIQSIQKMVPDSGIGLTNFDDFPVAYPVVVDGGQTYYSMCGQEIAGDLPFRVLGDISTDASVIQKYTTDPLFKTRSGADGPESGAESLYQIATGEGVSWTAGSYSGYFLTGSDGSSYQFTQGTYSWKAGSVPKKNNAPNTWGGVNFRNESLPIVIHTTDIASHDELDFLDFNVIIDGPLQFPYPKDVVNPHYTRDLLPALKRTGIRVITLNVASHGSTEFSADDLMQMTTWSKESKAIVPACAFDNKCGKNKCCLGAETSDPISIDGRDNQCILAYKSSQSNVSDTVVQGVDALIKYGTYTVATKVRGEEIIGKSIDTSCFIKQVVATTYVPPPQEPEKSCNPVAIPTKVDDSSYENGFENFAPGTSNASKKGAELHFTVVAQNDNCVAQTAEAQFFTAYIEVYDPTTGVSFGERKVSIIVPGGTSSQVN